MIIGVKKDAIKKECELTVQESMIHVAVALRIIRETCDEDLKDWFAEVGKKTFEQIDGLSVEDFDEYIAMERRSTEW